MKNTKNKKLRTSILEKYPELFAEAHDDRGAWPRTWWGFQCDDGWLPLIDNFCRVVQYNFICQSKQFPETKQPTVVQVKEKFGMLRVYIENSNDFIAGALTLAELISVRTCESCGKSGKLYPIAGSGDSDRWMRVRCSTCETKRKKKMKEESQNI